MPSTLEHPPRTTARAGLRAVRFLLLAMVLILWDHILDGMRGTGPWWQP